MCRALLLLSHFRYLEHIVHTILLNILYTLLYCLTLFRDVSESQNEHDLNICVLHVTRGESQLTRCEFQAISSLLSFPTTIHQPLLKLSFLETPPTSEYLAYTHSIPTIHRTVYHKLICLKADLSLRSQVLTEDCVSPLETHTIPP